MQKIGIQTIGNATLIAYDNFPIISTDTWLNYHEAYFGSWSLKFKIPKEIEKDIFNCEYIFFTHGHPDHLNPHSIKKFKNKKILLPDHVGSRIYKWLKNINYNVHILKDRSWRKLSDKISVMSIADYNQDSILLLNINNKLFINSNDATIRNCRSFIKKISKQFNDVYLLSLSGYGDADMINIFTEQGERVNPSAAYKFPVGVILSERAKSLGANNVVPFSSFHRYSRSDSIWAEKYTTPLDAYEHKFDFKNLNFIKPFSYIDCISKETYNLKLKDNDESIANPEKYGDLWSDELSQDDFKKIQNYFLRLELLKNRIGFLNFKVGKKDNNFWINKDIKKGITFEVPKTSLMKAINYEIFDDLLIGNFMKTTFHGKGINSLYDVDFTPIVTKYADNGRIFTKEEYKKYLKEYRLRSEGEWLRDYFEQKTSQIFRKYVHYDSNLYKMSRKAYNVFKKFS